VTPVQLLNVQNLGSKVGKVIAGRRTYTARSAGLGLTPSASNLRCEECKRTFTSANRLVAHLRVHEQGTHECPECDKVFKKLVSLQTHMRTHSGEAQPKFPCSICKKRFSSQVHLLRHRRTTHTTERRFKCNICGKPFKKQIHLRNHLRTHTGERPFQCSVCGKTFSSLANLSRHGLTHTGVHPYRCDICHKAFSQSSNLRQHRQHLHSNTTPSPCPDCSATFIRPAKFVAHRFLHHPGSPESIPQPVPEP
uniref:Zinc finger protein 574-like n=1 Tax=Sinocyclocheilus grahami TaxID=75366 RepID=A0A672K3D3_SINGR